MIEIRKNARLNKDWALSDQLREELSAMNIVLEDSNTGTRWSVKK